MKKLFRRASMKRKPKDIVHIETETSVDMGEDRNGKILICDDASGNRMVLRRYINAISDIQIDEATNGLDAINMIKRNGVYNIVWIDMSMPVMGGVECARELTEQGYNGTIIGITGNVDPVSIKKCLDAGMTRVMSKPIDRDVLKTIYHEYFNV